jgi:hypothetical protein
MQWVWVAWAVGIIIISRWRWGPEDKGIDNLPVYLLQRWKLGIVPGRHPCDLNVTGWAGLCISLLNNLDPIKSIDKCCLQFFLLCPHHCPWDLLSLEKAGVDV